MNRLRNRRKRSTEVALGSALLLLVWAPACERSLDPCVPLAEPGASAEGCASSPPGLDAAVASADAGSALVAEGGPPAATDGGSKAHPTPPESADAGETSSGDLDGGAAEPDVADAGPGEEPFVRFVSPAPGGAVENPVRFIVEASDGVEQVRIFADESWPLGPAFDPEVQSDLLYRFVGTGTRALHVEGTIDGVVVAREDLVIEVAQDSCEERFFVHNFDLRNVDESGSLDMVQLREGALAAIEEAVADLQACGAGVTLGGMLSLLLYEGGFRVGAFNTICEENSYNNTATNCDAVPEAYYSYQYGLGAIHASNFHPCRGGAYTQGMRAALLAALDAHGFPADASTVSATEAARFASVCPNATPTAVDHYLLGAHDVFGVPRDSSGNHLEGNGVFPFFTPEVSIELTFRELLAQCASIDDDRDAITVFGGGDAAYGTLARQNAILSYYAGFAASSCP